MLSSDLIRRIRRIQIRTNRLVTDVLAGQYHSAFKGRGMEFEEVRPYLVGDDVRTIDWNVSARLGDPHVKLFREERELTVMLAVDLSASQSFGSRVELKRELVAEIAGTLAFSAIRNHDKVGLLAFTDRIELLVPPRKGPRHVLRIIRELLALEPRGTGTDLAAAMDELRRIFRRRGVLFLVSDFLAEGWEPSFRTLRRRHDLIPIVVEDPRERELPDVGLVELTDAETARRVTIDTGDRRVRRRFAALAQARRDLLVDSFRRLGADPIRIATGESFVDPIAAYFRRREGRRR
ncbi:MAG: DUF58 domain-containing protein [Phycisphaerae bacterium]|nr:DUF58 domain-containing protein [Phycisphaerae bacterium]